MEDELIIRAADIDDIGLIGYIAQQVWPVAYKDILSEEQLNYMLTLFYSPASLRKQITSDKHHFLIAELNDEAVGFASFGRIDAHVFKLHKLYVLSTIQKNGIGKALVDAVKEGVKEEGGSVLRLNVNRNNAAQNFYQRLGFQIVGQEDIDIGNGFLMQDFVMESGIVN